MRIAAYEESGRFIGHRVLPVVGLCPGYRHVNLRTELGQPLPLATLFVHIVVKDYVPDGLSDFAEALANPIKYQSDLEKRAEQLAVLTDDMEISEITDEQKKSTLTKVKEPSTNGSPTQRPSISAGAASLDLTTDNETTCTTNVVNSIPTLPEQNSINKSIDLKEEKFEELSAEPLEKIMENKLVKEKKMELDKKLESLRKKHEKKRMTLQTQKSGEFGTEKKKLINMKLVKKLSSQKM